MLSFPAGQLFLREFKTVAEAHVTASQISGEFAPDVRLIEVAAMSSGAWVCGWVSSVFDTTKLAKKFGLDIVDIDVPVMNAFLSLGPKPSSTTTYIGICESSSIADVFRSAQVYVKNGYPILEIRLKRSSTDGGAYAFFDLGSGETRSIDGAEGLVTSAPLAMTKVPLIGDYRRFFV